MGSNYQQGLGNVFQSEAIPGALPEYQNSPQKAPYGLYPEQLSGSAFTMPINENWRSWLYRILPSVVHKPFQSIPAPTHYFGGSPELMTPTPNQLRWDPLPYPQKPTDFIEGLFTFAISGDPSAQKGSAIHLYVATQNMEEKFFYNSDGDLLIIPQEGKLLIKTEFGSLEVSPKEFAMIQRGIKFQVHLLEKKSRGYICEQFGAHFKLPDHGPIGPNSLASPRNFLYPSASYEEKKGSFQLITKFSNQFFATEIDHSPFNVVAWHGNYAPYKYNLEHFNTIGSISFDHPDPSIFTVMTSPSSDPGTPDADFVIFPERWMVAEHTFRPPYYHRNIMNEFMGNIYGEYDAKPSDFAPGSSSLHNCMQAHGPDAASFEKAIKKDLKPEKYTKTLSFMIESRYYFYPTPMALNSPQLQKNYHKCWKGIQSHFKKP